MPEIAYDTLQPIWISLVCPLCTLLLSYQSFRVSLLRDSALVIEIEIRGDFWQNLNPMGPQPLETISMTKLSVADLSCRFFSLDELTMGPLFFNLSYVKVR